MPADAHFTQTQKNSIGHSLEHISTANKFETIYAEHKPPRMCIVYTVEGMRAEKRPQKIAQNARLKNVQSQQTLQVEEHIHAPKRADKAYL